MSFSITCGTNISHWLSQSDKRGSERKEYFRSDDVKRIADLGLDHIRIPIDEVQMFSDDGKIDNEGFDLLNTALYWCKREKVRVIVDLHIMRSHYFNDSETPRLFCDPYEEQRFSSVWSAISSQISEWSEDMVAYELLNEPVARDPQDWNRVSHSALNELRKREPKRKIILGSNWFSWVDSFDELLVPDDPNVILTFHYYKPMLLTHYRASWWEGGIFANYDGPVHYPGKTIPDQIVQTFSRELKEKALQLNKFYDRNVIVTDLSKPLEVCKRTGAQLYCGEFGCIRLAPQKDAQRWYRDVVSVFREKSIAYSNWDYRGMFGILSEDRQDRGIAQILTSG